MSKPTPQMPDSAPAQPPEPAEPQVLPTPAPTPPKEYGGRRDGLEPTRYGDWEKNGRCIDF